MELEQKYSTLITYVISGLLLGIGFIFPWLWFCSLIGVGSFVLAISQSNSIKVVALGGVIAWTIKSALAVSWFWSTYPIQWLGVSLGLLELPAIGFFWISVSFFLGLGGVITAIIWWLISKSKIYLLGLLVFPFIWLVGELSSSLLFSIFTIGEGISINYIFSFGYLGYQLGNHDLLIYLSKFGGVYFLSLLSALIGYLLYLIYQTFPKPKSYIIVSSLILVLLVTSYITILIKDEIKQESQLKVAIVDTFFGGDFFTKDNYESLKNQAVIEAVYSALSLNPDYIILPEDSRYTPQNQSAELAYRFFRFESSDSEVVLIDSGKTVLENNQVVLRANIYDGLSKKGWSIDKQYLVPQGEFLPYYSKYVLGIFGNKNTFNDIKEKLNYQPGPLFDQSQLPQSVPAILFCSENINPYSVKKLLASRGGAPFIAHPVSHAWFHKSEVLQQQLDLMIRIQAIWNGVPIVSAGNMARGALYTKGGDIQYPKTSLEGVFWKVGIIDL